MGEKDNTKQEVDEKKPVQVEDKKKLDEGPITIILKLDLHCEGCAKKVKKSIRYIQGVDSIKADSANNKLTIVGKLDPLYIKERVEYKTKKKVEIISPKPKKDEGGDKKGDEKPVEVKSNDQKPKEPQSTTVVLKISLHCDGCIQKIKRIISKIDGVESVKADANKNLVTVKGTMNMTEVIPYLKDKLKRNVDIVVPPKKEENKVVVDEKKDEKKVEGGDDKKNEKDGDNDKKKDVVEKSEDGEKKKKNAEAEAAVVGDQKKPDGEAKAKTTVAGDGDGSKNADVINRFEHYTHVPYTYTMPMYNQNYHNQDYGISGHAYGNEGYQNHGYMMQYPHGPPPPPSPMSLHNPRSSEPDMFSVENANACSIM